MSSREQTTERATSSRKKLSAARKAQAELQTPPESFSIVIASGGTGGHLIPGIAIAQEFQRLVPDARITFLIPGKSLERSILDAHGMDYLPIGGRSPRGGPIAKARALWDLFSAYRRAKAALRELKPSLVFAAGGYGSVCGGYAARKLRIPLHLLEQNVVPGRVNRLLAKIADTAWVQWPLYEELKGRAKVEVCGNPIRRSIGRYDRNTAARLLDFSPEKKTLLVMGGSQGASAINDFIADNLLKLEKYHRKLQVIHLTGNRDYNEIRRKWAHSRVRHRVMPFASDMGPLLCSADVVLCRAGATTIAEVTALGKPLALVPLPTSADNHQYLNAKYVAEQGAGVVIKQEKLERPNTLEALLDEVVLSDSHRSTLADCSSLMGRPRAGKEIALRALKACGYHIDDRAAQSDRQQRRAA